MINENLLGILYPAFLILLLPTLEHLLKHYSLSKPGGSEKKKKYQGCEVSGHIPHLLEYS
jgi:hypothetical protein